MEEGLKFAEALECSSAVWDWCVVCQHEKESLSLEYQ